MLPVFTHKRDKRDQMKEKLSKFSISRTFFHARGHSLTTLDPQEYGGKYHASQQASC